MRTYLNCFIVLLFAAVTTQPVQAQTNNGVPEVLTMAPHSETSRFWAAGQINIIFQTHPGFSAKYSGPNSLRPDYEKATSRVLTLYTGVQLGAKTDLLVDFESAGGRGLSDALGLAGFTNLDVVRNPELGSTPYLARLLIHHSFRLSNEYVETERGPLSLARRQPARRIEVWAGKLSTVDFFDTNSVPSDSHLQFTNWTVDNNGAYDYAADTRGYTYGVVMAYQDNIFAVRFGELLMPQVANGIDIEFNLRRAHSEDVEVEVRGNTFGKRKGVVRVLGYGNHANMGVYREAVADFLTGKQPVPDITAHPHWTRLKYGIGLNVEQEITPNTTAFGRLGWNNGKTESFAYTEVDRTVEVGARQEGPDGTDLMIARVLRRCRTDCRRITVDTWHSEDVASCSAMAL
ncbi:MAG TPA: carbohydrate porin [Terriglobales bacterium]|nr:carbohydrate porin [Terriglobales bacterium]